VVGKALQRHRETAVAIAHAALLKIGTIAVGKDDEAASSGRKYVDRQSVKRVSSVKHPAVQAAAVYAINPSNNIVGGLGHI
jgi:hypothetical protein